MEPEAKPETLDTSMGEPIQDVDEDAIEVKTEDKVEGGLFDFIPGIPNIDDEPDFYIEDGVKYHDCLCCHIPEMAHNIIKFILFAFNVLFWIVAFVLVVIGIWASFVNADYGNALDSIMAPSFIFIALGVILFLVTFAGCLGALRENTHLLKAFVVIMGIGLVIQLGLVVYCFVFVDSLSSKLNTFFKGAIKDYYDDIDTQNALDLMQNSQRK